MALSQAETGLLTQEAATQLTQARLSMQQLAQGSSRLQACRWVDALLQKQKPWHGLRLRVTCLMMLQARPAVSQGVTLLPAPIFNAHPLLLLHVYCCPAMSTCRWFSELLLLKTRGLVQLQQGGAYDDVEVGLTQPGVAATASQLLTTMLTQSQ